MKNNKYIPKTIKNLFSGKDNFSEEINKFIEKHKDKKLSVLNTMYLNTKLLLDSKMIQPSIDVVNMLTALKFLIEKKSARKDFYKILAVAIITPTFSVIISVIVSLLIKH
ncbi:MAG: hypothetical protein K2L48_01230 [Mycoplasmoidaceae bacterium]|nr:hypothetical protein [Mycoplasmoidaceae bacterium]